MHSVWWKLIIQLFWDLGFHGIGGTSATFLNLFFLPPPSSFFSFPALYKAKKMKLAWYTHSVHNVYFYRGGCCYEYTFKSCENDCKKQRSSSVGNPEYPWQQHSLLYSARFTSLGNTSYWWHSQGQGKEEGSGKR